MDGLSTRPAQAPPGARPTGGDPRAWAVVAEKLTRSFRGVPAVVDLDLNVRAGEIYGLVGADGAGKTTALRLLCGVLAADAGRATVLGYDVATEAERLRPLIGYMAQGFALYRDLTVAENLAFFADVFTVPEAERGQRLDDLTAFAGLEPYAERRAAHLSGGMQKRLALACSMVHAPSVLVLDEPTTGVDPVARREFWAILTRLHLGGATIVVSTPYMDEAERCSRVALIHEGRIVRCDTPDALRSALPGRLLEVRTTDPRAAGRALAHVDGALGIQVYGDRVHVTVDSAEDREALLRDALAAAGVEVQTVRAARPRMEEAFFALLEAQRASGR